MNTYMVTGAAGFIGAKVAELLLRDGNHVVGVDNLNIAYDVRLKRWRLAQLEAMPGFTFQCADIAQREGLRSIFRNPGTHNRNSIAAVINLAARAGVRESLKDPWAYYETNVTGTLNILELCREFGVGKFLLASTSSLYGAHNPQPFKEDANTDLLLSPYAASKKAAETLCYTYHHLHGLDVTVLRYFTVYGPAGRPDMAPFRFIKWIAEGEPLTLFGDGTQQRDFTYVDDIARGTVAALRPMGYEVINLGTEHPVVLMELVRLIEKLTGRQACIRREPRHPADVMATCAETSKARRLLGWQPTTSFAEGIQNAVAWYQENRQWAREIAT